MNWTICTKRIDEACRGEIYYVIVLRDEAGRYREVVVQEDTWMRAAAGQTWGHP